MPQRATDSRRLDIRVECFMLCDHVRVENGKLYILGGGWTRLTPPYLPLPYSFHIALKLAVPAELAGAPLPLQLEVRDAEGRDIATSALDIQTEPADVPDQGAAPTIPLNVPLGVDLTFVSPGVFTLALAAAGERIAETALLVAAPAPPRANEEGATSDA